MTKISNLTASCGINKNPLPNRQGNRMVFKTLYRDFYRKEDGSTLSFSIAIMTMMLLIGGLAVDVMRAERQRTQIQYTGDRATLAAASVKQTESAQDIVDDYFEKDGISEFTPTATREEGLNFRRVITEYETGSSPTIGTFFIDALGVDTLPTPAAATAEDGVGMVEISMVLDVSGSMGWASSASGNPKINDLKVAAKEFVDTLLLGRADDDTTFSISIIPYSTQVTAGEALLSKYTMTNEHNSSHCIDFTADDFLTTEIDSTVEMQRTGHFSPWTDSKKIPARWWTRTCIEDTIVESDGSEWDANRKILPLSDDADQLKDYIDGLLASGWTSTEVGIKWGAALLDPETRPVIDHLVDDNVVSTDFSGRPHEYTEESVLKIMVVMTDGENTNQYFLDPDVADGASPVWYKTDIDETIRSFWVHNPTRSGPKYRRLDYNNDGDLITDLGWTHGHGTDTTQLTYQGLWDLVTMRFASDELFGPAGLGDNWHSSGWNDHFSRIAWDEKDNRMANICAAAKNNDVTMYTIGFEVEDDNAAKLMSCASTDAHFYRVEGVEISEAFAAIASQINNLRLIK